MPAKTASSMTYWMSGLSTNGSISLGCAFVAGKKRVPRPAAGNTAFEMRIALFAPQVMIGSVEPVLPGRRKHVEVESVFQRHSGVDDIGGNVQNVAGVQNDFFSMHFKFQ